MEAAKLSKPSSSYYANQASRRQATGGLSRYRHPRWQMRSRQGRDKQNLPHWPRPEDQPSLEDSALQRWVLSPWRHAQQRGRHDLLSNGKVVAAADPGTRTRTARLPHAAQPSNSGLLITGSAGRCTRPPEAYCNKLWRAKRGSGNAVTSLGRTHPCQSLPHLDPCYGRVSSTILSAGQSKKCRIIALNTYPCSTARYRTWWHTVRTRSLQDGPRSIAAVPDHSMFLRSELMNAGEKFVASLTRGVCVYTCVSTGFSTTSQQGCCSARVALTYALILLVVLMQSVSDSASIFSLPFPHGCTGA